MSALTLKGATLPEILLNLENCTRWGARFVAPSEEATFYPYQDVLRRAQKAAAALQARGLQRGDRVALDSFHFDRVFRFPAGRAACRRHSGRSLSAVPAWASSTNTLPACGKC